MLLSLLATKTAHQLFHQRIGIASVLCNFSCVLIEMLGIEPLMQHAIEQSLAQHLDQALSPVPDLFPQEQAFAIKILAIRSDGLHQFAYSPAVGGNGLEDGRRPVIPA